MSKLPGLFIVFIVAVSIAGAGCGGKEPQERTPKQPRVYCYSTHGPHVSPCRNRVNKPRKTHR